MKAMLDIGLPLHGCQQLGLVLFNVQTILGILETYFGKRQDKSIEIGVFSSCMSWPFVDSHIRNARPLRLGFKLELSSTVPYP